MKTETKQNKTKQNKQKQKQKQKRNKNKMFERRGRTIRKYVPICSIPVHFRVTS